MCVILVVSKFNYALFSLRVTLLLSHDDDSLEDVNLHPHLLLLERKYHPLSFMLIFDDFTFIRVDDDYFLHEFHDGLNWLNVR
jgi:hypothetical protein